MFGLGYGNPSEETKVVAVVAITNIFFGFLMWIDKPVWPPGQFGTLFWMSATIVILVNTVTTIAGKLKDMSLSQLGIWLLTLAWCILGGAFHLV